MKNWYSIIAVAVLGIAIVAWNKWEFSDVRWSPLYDQQIPRPNATTQFGFWSDSGVFEIEVKLPMSAAEISETGGIADKPPVSCDLGFHVRAGEDVVSHVDVISLHWTGIVGYTHMNCFDAGTINIPKFAKYVLELTNAGGGFNFPAANFSLIRQQNAENAAVLSGISNVLGYALLGTSLLAAVFLGVRHWVRRGKPQMPITN